MKETERILKIRNQESRQAEKKTALFVIQKNKPKLFRCFLSSEISLFTFLFAVSFFPWKIKCPLSDFELLEIIYSQVFT